MLKLITLSLLWLATVAAGAAGFVWQLWRTPPCNSFALLTTCIQYHQQHSSPWLLKPAGTGALAIVLLWTGVLAVHLFIPAGNSRADKPQASVPERDPLVDTYGDNPAIIRHRSSRSRRRQAA